MIVNISEPNRRLFVGPVPKTKTKEEIWSAFASIVDGICDVIVQEPAEPSNTAKNKGFCFLDFSEHKLAAQVDIFLINWCSVLDMRNSVGLQ